MSRWLERTETVLLLALWGTVLWLCLKVAFWILSLLRGGFMAGSSIMRPCQKAKMPHCSPRMKGSASGWTCLSMLLVSMTRRM